MTSIQECTACILDSNIPDIEFNADGVCSHCEEHQLAVEQFPSGAAGEAELQKLVREIKASSKGNEYDCLVGVSGGIDSIYTLYMAVQMGLKPLAFQFDNGWHSEIAVSNIKSACEILKVDLETYVVNWEEFKDILTSFLKASTPDADVPTDIGIKSTIYSTAKKYRLKYVISGVNFRTEGKIPRLWSYMDSKYIKSVYKMFTGKKLKYFPNLTLWGYFKNIFLNKIKGVSFINYIDYNKEEAKKLLTEKVGWRDYGGKHFESIFTRFNQTCIRYKKLGIDMRLIEYAALVRDGQYTKAEAKAIVAKAPYTDEQLAQDIEYVKKKLELTDQEFEEIMNTPAKNFLDYPTHFPFIQKVKWFTDKLSKRIKRI